MVQIANLTFAVPRPHAIALLTVIDAQPTCDRPNRGGDNLFVVPTN
ncbi:MAG: hypothetical protein GDA43_23480 [Hormoscilla sp. SP5CHS1]|nr:hypothetical protein [Hormoscilla sp. SP12CHS1]MBC6455777.1 hypothetical protein [Hormoscilla sp. SP5CHS1]